MSASTVPTIAATTNPLKELFGKYGQSAWLDYIRRSLISSGQLKAYIDEDGLGGVTSNVQVTCDDKADLLVPGNKFTFGVVKAAQARGDFEVLAERGRRALRVHLGDAESGLKTLQNAVTEALG